MEKTIGSLIIDLEGTVLSPEEREMLAHPLVGGVILFTRNYESREQLMSLCQAIRASRSLPLLIMVDQEGGRVQRFQRDFTRLPPMAVFGQHYDQDSVSACLAASDCGWLMATELLAAGVDLSLAPVLDLNKGLSSVIGDRAFHGDANAVIELTTAFIQGMHAAGMASTGKHFPGHGSVHLDTHKSITVDERPLKVIVEDDLRPFAGLIKNNISAIMAAHIIFPQVDNKPVGFSHVWLQEVLRTQLGFAGAIFSDDLKMEGANISTNYADRFDAALQAGCDFAMLCNHRPGVIQVLDNIDAAAYQVDKLKWGALQGDFSRVTSYQQQDRWQKARAFLLSETHERLTNQ